MKRWMRLMLDSGSAFPPKAVESLAKLTVRSMTMQLKHEEEMRHLVPEEEIKEGVLNAHLFRLYVYHWMMNNPHVSQLPRLVVRWMEQKETGLPLQVYAFILDTSVTAFEWQQSLIIEHIVESLDWFGLRLYQNPSSYDIHSCMDCLANNEVTKRKETAS